MSRAILDTLVDIARDAGDVIMRVYSGDFAVEYKGPSDPVTAADRRANELICERLELAFPGDSIVAEESAPETFKDYRQSARVFFVDPLDGTREFVARNGEFVVMIGMLDAEHATAGVVHAPVSGTTWSGHLALGAFRLDANGHEQAIEVGSVRRPELARVVASRSQRSRALQEALNALSARETLAVGSAGLKGAQVADGSADAYVSVGRSGKYWDACAVDALVSAAGGRVTDARGEPLDYRSADMNLDHGILVSNEHLHAALLKRLLG